MDTTRRDLMTQRDAALKAGDIATFQRGPLMHYHVNERCDICQKPYRQNDRVQRVARAIGRIDGRTVTLPHLVFDAEVVTTAHMDCAKKEAEAA